MTQRDKLIARIRARPPEADVNDVCKLLEEFGWTLGKKRATSHIIYKKPGERSMTIPTVKGRKVKQVYLDEICKRLGLDD